MELPPRDPERDLPLNGEKYRVSRTDGSTKPGGKHAACDYFVLDLVHDRFARPALRAYADACEKDFPHLARDLRKRLGEMPG